MASCVYERQQAEDLPAFLAGLARARGFLLEHELPDSVEIEGGEAAPVLSLGGETIGAIHLPVARSQKPIPTLLESTPTQSPRERQEFLEQLELVETQLVGWLLLRGETKGIPPATDEHTLREKLVFFVESEPSWKRMLAVPGIEDEAMRSTARLSKEFEKAGVNRKDISDYIHSGMSQWRRTIFGDQFAVESADRAIAQWASLSGAIRARLLEGNIRLVLKAAASQSLGMNPIHAIQSGIAGFNRALDSYERDRGHQLSTYASWWIRQSIARVAVNFRNPIRVPVHAHGRIRRLVHEYCVKWQPGSTRAAALGSVIQEVFSEDSRVARLVDHAEPTWPTTRRVSSGFTMIEDSLFDPTASQQGTTTTWEFIKPARAMLQSVLEDLFDSREHLPKQQQRNIDVLTRRLAIGQAKRHTLEEIADDHKVSRERIRQVEEKVLKKAKARSGDRIVEFLNAVAQIRHVAT